MRLLHQYKIPTVLPASHHSSCFAMTNFGNILIFDTFCFITHWCGNSQDVRNWHGTFVFTFISDTFNRATCTIHIFIPIPVCSPSSRAFSITGNTTVFWMRIIWTSIFDVGITTSTFIPGTFISTNTSCKEWKIARMTIIIVYLFDMYIIQNGLNTTWKNTTQSHWKLLLKW